MSNYEKFSEELILRDYLAIDRTMLANERTLLSYLRTTFGLAAAGVVMIKLFDISTLNIISYIFIIISPFFTIIGILRFIRVRQKLKTISKSSKTKGNVNDHEE